jgi:diguanylate cyclase (GGDEF)-like protein
MLKPSRHWVWNLAIVASLAALYGVVYMSLYNRFGFPGAPFAAVTVVLAAWMFGSRGGMLTCLLLVVENLLLLYFFADQSFMDTMRKGSLFGFLSLVVIAVAVGRMGDLDRKVKEYAAQLQHQAFHDPLTQLPNRALFSDRLEHARARAARGATTIAVLFLDLDGFKRINDHHGHAVGDRVLQAVAKRMQETLRESDTVARLGGDEFVALIEDIDGVDSARRTAERLSYNLAQPFYLDGVAYTISVSIGIASCDVGGMRSTDLLRDADRAMYQAKASGSGRYVVFQPLLI